MIVRENINKLLLVHGSVVFYHYWCLPHYRNHHLLIIWFGGTNIFRLTLRQKNCRAPPTRKKEESEAIKPSFWLTVWKRHSPTNHHFIKDQHFHNTLKRNNSVAQQINIVTNRIVPNWESFISNKKRYLFWCTSKNNFHISTRVSSIQKVQGKTKKLHVQGK